MTLTDEQEAGVRTAGWNALAGLAASIQGPPSSTTLCYTNAPDQGERSVKWRAFPHPAALGSASTSTDFTKPSPERMIATHASITQVGEQLDAIARRPRGRLGHLRGRRFGGSKRAAEAGQGGPKDGRTAESGGSRAAGGATDVGPGPLR